MRLIPITPLLALLAAAPTLAAERTFPVGDFRQIILSGAADVEILPGAPRVVASGSEASLDRLDIRVEGGRLLIGTKPGTGWGMSPRDQVRIRVSAAGLEALSLSGSGDVRMANAGALKSARISGSGDIELANLDTPELSLQLSGSGDVLASGRCVGLAIGISGSGDVDAGGLTCTKANIRVSGAGDVRATVTGTAGILVSGVGDVTITGGAACTSRTSGAGRIRCS